MKKINTLLLSIFLFSCINLYAQEITEKDSASNEYKGQLLVKPFTKKDYKHWSLSIDAGLNQPYTDMYSDPNHILKNIVHHWSLGANVEYTINPVFSIGFSYMFATTSMEEKAGRFESNVHHFYPFVGINLLNYPFFNRNHKWDLWFTAGVGAHHMNSLVNYPFKEGYFYNGKPLTEDIWNDPDVGVGAEHAKKWGGVIPVGAELSYYITKEVAISLKYTHFMYTHDRLEGSVKHREFSDPYNRKRYAYTGSANDNLANLLLSVRWDITGKDNTHMRKVSWQEYKASEPKKQAPEKQPIDMELLTLLGQKVKHKKLTFVKV